ncbi:hypothetical protein HDU67_005606, partial [Dinochytrium kinnereticum]
MLGLKLGCRIKNAHRGLPESLPDRRLKHVHRLKPAVLRFVDTFTGIAIDVEKGNEIP